MKRLLIPALLASSAFVLSGCLDVDADLSVNEDATATGEMTIAISSEISGLLGLGSGVELVDQLKQGMLDGAEGVEDLDCQPADQENAVAMVCSFENQVFDQADDASAVSRQSGSPQVRLHPVPVVNQPVQVSR